MAALWITQTYPFWIFRRRRDLAREVLLLRHQLMGLEQPAGQCGFLTDELWQEFQQHSPGWERIDQ